MLFYKCYFITVKHIFIYVYIYTYKNKILARYVSIDKVQIHLVNDNKINAVLRAWIPP